MLQSITITLRRPLVSLAAAAAIANQPTNEITEAVEAGDLQFSFDIGGAGRARRAIRILASSLAAYIEQAKPVSESKGQLASVVNSIFPALATDIRTDTLCRILSCERKLVFSLARGKEVECVNHYRRGVGGTAKFSRRSCVEFLIKRRIQ